MRTTLNIDDELMTALLERNPGASKTEAVEQAIRAYLERDSVERILALRGKIQIEDLSAQLRAIDRRA